MEIYSMTSIIGWVSEVLLLSLTPPLNPQSMAIPGNFGLSAMEVRPWLVVTCHYTPEPAWSGSDPSSVP